MAARITKFTAAGSTNLQPIAGTELSQVAGWNIINTAAAARFVKLYYGNRNTFSSNGDTPTVGTDVPRVTIQIPATSGVTASFPIPLAGPGTLFVATTVNAADTDATAVTAGDLIVSLFTE